MSNQANNDERTLDRLIRAAGDPRVDPSPQYVEKLRATILARVGSAETVANVSEGDWKADADPIVALDGDRHAQPETTRPTFLARSRNTWRQMMRHSLSRATAVAVLLLSTLGVVLWFHGGGVTLAFADFVKPILEAKTVRCKGTVEIKGPPAMKGTTEQMVLDGTRSRTETIMPDKSKLVQITDWGRGKSISLNSTMKHATIQEFTNMPKNARNEPGSWIHVLQMAQDNVKSKDVQFEPLGEKEIDGRRAIGFRMIRENGATDLWGDPKTGLPVRVEVTTGMNGGTKVTFSDFEFNVDMDESLFSVEPPVGYTVSSYKSDLSPDVEKDMVEMFREYTEVTDGAFPDSLDSRKVSQFYFAKCNIRLQWEDISRGKGSEEQRRQFEEEMFKISDRIMAKAAAGEPFDEETREMQALICPIVSEAVWEQWKEMFPETWKTNAEQKRKFKDLMRRNMEGKPNEKQQEISEHIQEFMIEMIWENCAPEDVRTNVELRQQFENLMRKSGKKSSDGERKQETDDGIRKIGGDKMLEAMKAWEAKKKASEAKEGQADTQETVEAREAKSKAFMEAQGQIQRGLTFANQLPASADMHYAGKGVVLGAVDTPIFWYKPTGSEKYHVIYADLSVKEMSPDEAGNLAEAKPEQ